MPGITSIPPLDRDESRFAQASRQMLESVALSEAERAAVPLDLYSGGLVVPKVIEKPRLNKPPLIYWLQAGSAWVFSLGEPLRDAVWMYRVPSVLSAWASVLLTWRIGLVLFDGRAALLGGVLLAICPLVVVDAHQARADQLLLACTTAAMWAVARIVRAEASRRASPGGTLPRPRPSRNVAAPVALALAVALGVLAKGPITPMVVGFSLVTYAAITRRWRVLFSSWPWLTAVVAVASLGPWVYAVAETVGFEEYRAMVFDETVGRSTSAKEGHSGPPGYHALLLPVLFFPGSIGLAMANILLWSRCGWRRSGSGGAGWSLRWGGSWRLAFLASWLFPAWIVFELVSTKLPHYTMPMYPAGAILCGRAVLAAGPLARVASSKILRALVFGWACIPAVVGAGLVVFARASSGLYQDSGVVLGAGVAGAVMLIGLFVSGRFGLARVRAHLAAQSVSWTVAVVVLFAVAAPGFNTMSPSITAALDRLGWDGSPVVLGRYQEDSLVFMLRGRALREGDKDRAVEAVLARPDRYFVVSPSAGLKVFPTKSVLVRGDSMSKGPRRRVRVGQLRPWASPRAGRIVP
ncbi:MAG: glycosyltransferase family 39 protein [Planctomycetota bacterium]